MVVAGCARRSAEPNPTGPSTSDSASASATDSPSDSASASPTEDGTPISTEQLKSIIATTRQGLGASIGVNAGVSGAINWQQLFNGTVDVDSGIATGEVSIDKQPARERIIIDSTMYTKTVNRWVAVPLDGQGVAEGDVLQLWSLASQVTDARQKSIPSGSNITGKLPASMLVKAFGKAFAAEGGGKDANRLAVAAKGVEVKALISTNVDGFISLVSFIGLVNIDGTPTPLMLGAMLSDYGQVLDVRKPVTGPLYTPEGQ